MSELLEISSCHCFTLESLVITVHFTVFWATHTQLSLCLLSNRYGKGVAYSPMYVQHIISWLREMELAILGRHLACVWYVSFI